jgi:hypothetical protein
MSGRLELKGLEEGECGRSGRLVRAGRLLGEGVR